MSLRRLVPRSILIAWVAAMFAAFVVSLIFLLVLSLRGTATVRPADLVMLLIAAFVAATMTGYCSLVLGIAVGIPLFGLWRRRGYKSLAAYFLAGVLLSGATIAAVSAAHYAFGFLEMQLLPLAFTIAAVAGPVASITVRRFERASSSP
jgi:hypothetical protein